MEEPGRWSLSPAYDMNPVPEVERGRMNKMHESGFRSTEHRRCARVAPRFGLKAPDAKAILRDVVKAISGWKKTEGKLRLRAATIAAYENAFENELTGEARRLLNL